MEAIPVSNGTPYLIAPGMHKNLQGVTSAVSWKRKPAIILLQIAFVKLKSVYQRVSLGLTFSRKTAKKTLAAGRKNWQILTVSHNISNFHIFPKHDVHFYLYCLEADAVPTNTHFIPISKTRTFGAGTLESYSADRKCLFFARLMSWLGTPFGRMMV